MGSRLRRSGSIFVAQQKRETLDRNIRTMDMSRRGSQVLGAFLLIAIGCDEGRDGPLIERADSAGIEMVTSVVDDRPLSWRIERGIALGGEDEGPESFFRVAAGLVGSDSLARLYVLDPQQRRVVIFEADGSFIGSVGREGEGPGELSSPGSLSVDADGTISVFDFGRAALVRFSADGTVLPQFPLPFFPWPGPTRHFEVTPGGVLVASMLPSPPEGQFHHALRLIGPVDTVIVAERLFARPGMVRYPSCGGGLNLPAIFEMPVTWATNGPLTVAVESPAYELMVLEGARPIRKVRINLPTRAATEALAVAELGEGFSINFGRGPCTIPPQEMVEGRGFADAVPWIDQVIVAPTDEIWVHRKGVGEEIPATVDVFDATGAYAGTLPPGAPFPLVFLDANTFGAAETDEFDITRLVIYGIERGSSP